MRFELTTPTLARLCSTPELRPHPIGGKAAGRPKREIKRIAGGFARGNLHAPASRVAGRPGHAGSVSGPKFDIVGSRSAWPALLSSRPTNSRNQKRGRLAESRPGPPARRLAGVRPRALPETSLVKAQSVVARHTRHTMKGDVVHWNGCCAALQGPISAPLTHGVNLCQCLGLSRPKCV